MLTFRHFLIFEDWCWPDLHRIHLKCHLDPLKHQVIAAKMASDYFKEQRNWQRYLVMATEGAKPKAELASPDRIDFQRSTVVTFAAIGRAG